MHPPMHCNGRIHHSTALVRVGVAGGVVAQILINGKEHNRGNADNWHSTLSCDLLKNMIAAIRYKDLI